MNRYENIIPIMAEFMAGIFIYIALADILPELHSEKKYLILYHTIGFLIGLGVMTFIVLYFNHSH